MVIAALVGANAANFCKFDDQYAKATGKYFIAANTLLLLR